MRILHRLPIGWVSVVAFFTRGVKLENAENGRFKVWHTDSFDRRALAPCGRGALRTCGFRQHSRLQRAPRASTAWAAKCAM